MPALILHAQRPGELFRDDFRGAVGASPRTLAEQQTDPVPATDGDPDNAIVGGEAGGGPGLSGVQATSTVDRLSVSLAGDQLTLSWGGSGAVLQRNRDLSDAAGWMDVADGETSPVVLTAGAAQEFYRLSPVISDCASLQAAINDCGAMGGGIVKLRPGTTIRCQSYRNPIEPLLQNKQSLLVREGVMLDLNGGTIEIDPTETAHGIRLCSHSGIGNGLVRVVAERSTALQGIFNSGISVGAAYGEGGTAEQPSYFSAITDWRMENLTIDQPFARAAIQIMAGSNQGVITNVQVLDSERATHGIGLDWGTVGPLTSQDGALSEMRQLFEQGRVYSTHPHDISIEDVHIGRLANDENDDRAGLRASACYNITMRNVRVDGARSGIVLRGGDLGFEFALEPDRGLAHAGYSISGFTLSDIRGTGLLFDGLSDNVYRARLNLGYEPLLDPTYPGIKEASIRDGTIRGSGVSGSTGMRSFANSGGVFDRLDVQGFETGVRFEGWISGTAFRSGVVAYNNGFGLLIGIGGPEPGLVAPSNLVVAASSIFRNGVTVARAAGVRTALAEDVSISGNTIGALTGSETQFYGVYVGRNSSGVQVDGNAFGAVAPGGTPLFYEAGAGP